MKSLKMMCAAAALAAASFAIARAETIVAVRVPYPFVAAGMRMPAGIYYVHEMEPSGTVILRAPNGHSLMMASRPASAMSAEPGVQLTFRKQGADLVLSEIRDSASGSPRTSAAVR